MLRYALPTIASLLIPLGSLSADSCIPSTKANVGNSHFHLEIRRDRQWPNGRSTSDEPPTSYWSYSIKDKKSGKALTGPISQLPGHAHPHVYLSEDGTRFAIVDYDAETRYENRVLIFHANGSLVRSLGVKDILNKEELTQVQRSVNHLSWLGHDPETWDRLTRTHHIYSKANNSITLTTKAKRKVEISLTDGNILKSAGK